MSKLHISKTKETNDTYDNEVVGALEKWLDQNIDLSEGEYPTRDDMEEDIYQCLCWLVTQALDNLGFTDDKIRRISDLVDAEDYAFAYGNG